MRVKILKYQLTQLLDSITRIERQEGVENVGFEQMMPLGSAILHVHEHHDLPTMWVSAPTDATDLVERKFVVFPTGGEFDDVYNFVGSVHLPASGTVWHIYEDRFDSSKLDPIPPQEA